jgi:hypothetical protein
MKKSIIGRRRFLSLSVGVFAAPLVGVSLLSLPIRLTEEEFEEALDDLAKRAKRKGYGWIFNIGNQVKWATARIYVKESFQEHGYFPSGLHDVGRSIAYNFNVGIVDFSDVLPSHLCGGRRVIVDGSGPPFVSGTGRRI